MNSFQKLTDMIEIKDVISEMTKKYYKTYVCIENPDTGEKMYGQYRDWDTDDKKFVFLANGGQQRLPFDTPLKVYVPKLQRGLYNLSNHCVYVRQIPARQYRRGLSAESYKIVSLYQYIFGNGGGNDFFSYCVDVLSTPQKNYTVDEAEQMLVGHNDSGKPIPSVAINRDFALTHSSTGISLEDGYDLWYHASFVGKVFPDNKVIKVHNPVFFQEILDTQKSWCPNYMVN